MKLNDAFGNEIVVGSILLVPTFGRRRHQANRPAVVTGIHLIGLCVRLSYTWVVAPGYMINGHVERNIETLHGGRVDDVYVLEMDQTRKLTEKTADALNVISLYWHAKRELNQKMEELRGT